MRGKRSYEWILSGLGFLMLCCLLKWWLNSLWSEEITWLNYISIHGGLSILVCTLYFLHKKSLAEFAEDAFECMHWVGIALGFFPLFVLAPVCHVGGRDIINQDLVQEEWWNPVVWGECWLRQMQVTGWVEISVYSIIIVGILVYIIKANWDSEKWKWKHIALSISFFVVGFAVALWYAPLTIYIVGMLIEGIGELLRLVTNVLDFLAPE